MNQSIWLFSLLSFMFFHVEAQTTLEQGTVVTSPEIATSFRPSLAVVIGILCIMFSLTFILIVYAKFCHRTASVHADQQGLNRTSSRFSGIDKTVIESLPFFRFSSLKGSREGLECAVCLSKFEDIEVLRLLPKCKHAFHIGCVDQWLENHSSCPLCRHKVSAEDLTIFTYSTSLRFLWDKSELREDSNLELFVQREEDHHHGSSRFSSGSSFRKPENSRKEEELPIREESSDGDEEQKLFHKLNHKIIVSDVVYKNRWSNVSSSDLLFLNSEMINAMSSDRFSPLDATNGQLETTRAIDDDQIMKIKEEMDRKRLFASKANSVPLSAGHSSTSGSETNPSSRPELVASAEQRSKSEITALSRFAEKNKLGVSAFPENGMKEERKRKLWLPIARRTVQWFAANRERSPQESQHSRQSLNV
ncbi:E3 ubiquitin-protein ligase ATL42-like [Malania oleifera]|uniref:E3 ubiquitin-protein ligase ATL42-like n=1 Tax=Malania oleifera TaxID=397392 RepID=UPI0025AECB40|nr:E3 ubiquitin-protein ligase ATL42-like [Malania oleifera]